MIIMFGHQESYLYISAYYSYYKYVVENDLYWDRMVIFLGN